MNRARNQKVRVRILVYTDGVLRGSVCGLWCVVMGWYDKTTKAA